MYFLQNFKNFLNIDNYIINKESELNYLKEDIKMKENFFLFKGILNY